MKLIRQEWELVVTHANIDTYWEIGWELDGDTHFVDVCCSDGDGDMVPAFVGTFKVGEPDVIHERIPRNEWPEAVRQQLQKAVEAARKAVR